MEKPKRKPQSFLYGTFILLVATIICEFIGVVFRIPLVNLLGESGMGYFSTAYDLYLPIYALAMAGLPIAISRIVAEQITVHRYKDVRKTLKIAVRAFLITGIVSFIIMMIAAYPFVQITGNQGALPGILAIAPSLLMCCIMSAYRGYYAGLRNMYPTSISCIIESLCKLILGVGFAYLVIAHYGEVNATSSSYAAAACLFGITIGTVFGTFYLVLRHKVKGDGITAEELAASSNPIGTKQAVKNIIIIAIPVALGSLVSNVASLVDVTMVQRQLVGAVSLGGDTIKSMYSELISAKNLTDSEIPNALYGCYKGYAFSLYNLVPSITAALGVSALPVLASSWVEKNKLLIKKNIELMIKTTVLMAMPMGIGLSVMAMPIMNLLYSKQPLGVEVATPLLTILGIAAIFSGILAPLTNMLQAIGRQDIPVKNIAIGVVVKIVVNYILVGIPSINIIGAPIGTLACYVYIATANFVCLIKYSGVMPNLVKLIVKPLVASLICGAAAFATYSLFATHISNSISTVIALLVAAIIYVVAIVFLHAIDKEDIISLPNGEKIAKVLEIVGIIK